MFLLLIKLLSFKVYSRIHRDFTTCFGHGNFVLCHRKVIERSLVKICMSSVIKKLLFWMTAALPSSSPAGAHGHGLCDEENAGQSSQVLAVLPASRPPEEGGGQGAERGVLRAHHQLLPAAQPGAAQRTPLELPHTVTVIPELAGRHGARYMIGKLSLS